MTLRLSPGLTTVLHRPAGLMKVIRKTTHLCELTLKHVVRMPEHGTRKVKYAIKAGRDRRLHERIGRRWLNEV